MGQPENKREERRLRLDSEEHSKELTLYLKKKKSMGLKSEEYFVV